MSLLNTIVISFEPGVKKNMGGFTQLPLAGNSEFANTSDVPFGVGYLNPPVPSPATPSAAELATPLNLTLGLQDANFDTGINPLAPLSQSFAATPTVTLNGVPLTDRRVRIQLAPKSPLMLYKDSGNYIMEPLNATTGTNGLLFPLQPTITQDFSAEYQETKPVHSNFAFYSYQNSSQKAITLQGDFPVRTPWEGRYVIAAIHFLRSLTMMFTGYDGSLAGSPPPVVRLTGMGFGGLDNIPVVVTGVSSTYPNDVDYITCTMPLPAGVPPSVNNEQMKVPTLMSISVTLQPTFSRSFATHFSSVAYQRGLQRLLGPYTGKVPQQTLPTSAPNWNPTLKNSVPPITASLPATSFGSIVPGQTTNASLGSILP